MGGSGEIPLDPSLETEKGEERNLERWRLTYLWIQKTDSRQDKNEKKKRL